MSNTKKRLSVLLALIGVIAVGSVAYAYWTAGGTGTGTATTGTNAAITPVQTSTIANLYPGGPGQPITGNFTNNNDGPSYVSTVTAKITVAKATGAPAGTCDATDYALTNGGVMTVNADIPKGTAQGAFNGSSVSMINKSANQDACKNATLTITYTIA